MKLVDFKKGEFLKILGKGDPSTRKSTGFGDFPGPMYIADFDRKIAAMHKHWGHREDIEYDTYHPTVDDYEKFDQKLRTWQVQAKVGQLPYRTIMVDSLTSFGPAAIEYSLEKNRKTRSPNMKVGVVDLLSFDEYGVETRAMTNLINIGLALPCHFILIAHVITYDKLDVEAGKTKPVRKLVTAGNQIGVIIPAAFDETYHFMRGMNNQYVVMTQSGGVDYARTTLNLPPQIPNDGGLWKIIEPYANAKKVNFNQIKKEEIK